VHIVYFVGHGGIQDVVGVTETVLYSLTTSWTVEVWTLVRFLLRPLTAKSLQSLRAFEKQVKLWQLLARPSGQRLRL